MTEELTELKLVFLGDGYIGIKEESYNTDDTLQNFKTDEYKQLVSKIEQLEKKLSIVTKVLKELEIKSDKFDDSWSMTEQLDFIKAKCQETLYYIEEVE